MPGRHNGMCARPAVHLNLQFELALLLSQHVAMALQPQGRFLCSRGGEMARLIKRQH